MIAEGLIDLFAGFIRFVIGLFPTSGPPAFMQDATGALSTVWGYAAGLGAWIPWPLVGSVITAVLVSVVLGFGIKVVRLIASYLTAGGGSAG